MKECTLSKLLFSKADGVPTKRNTIHGHTAVEKFQCIRQMLKMAKLAFFNWLSLSGNI